MQNENDIFTQFNNERIEIAIRFEYYTYISWWIVIWRNQLVALKNTKHQILLSREKKIIFVQIEQYIQCNENDLKGYVLIIILSQDVLQVSIYVFFMTSGVECSTEIDNDNDNMKIMVTITKMINNNDIIIMIVI